MRKTVVGNPYQTLVNYDGLYESPKDEHGNYQGPLVAYAGKDPDGKNYVGFSYFNVAQVEQFPESRDYFTSLLAEKIKFQFDFPCHLIAAPMGGLTFCISTADRLNYRSSFFEKKVTTVADPEYGVKEESGLVYNRHTIFQGEKIILFEDLCNNFSTTQKMVNLMRSKGGDVVAIACVVNRSSKTSFNGIPVVSIIHIPTPEYSQNDIAVADLVQEGKVIWKPKSEWPLLREAMKNNKA